MVWRNRWAIARKKQIKVYSRTKKVKLIESFNRTGKIETPDRNVPAHDRGIPLPPTEEGKHEHA
jgi:hypothetical protein